FNLKYFITAVAIVLLAFAILRLDVTLGQRLAQEWCAKRHAIGPVGASPLQVAPPFRELHLRFNVEDLAESLGEGILVGHPSMPDFRFDPDQIENLIAYLKTLEKR